MAVQSFSSLRQTLWYFYDYWKNYSAFLQTLLWFKCAKTRISTDYYILHDIFTFYIKRKQRWSVTEKLLKYLDQECNLCNSWTLILNDVSADDGTSKANLCESKLSTLWVRRHIFNMTQAQNSGCEHRSPTHLLRGSQSEEGWLKGRNWKLKDEKCKRLL